MRGFSLKNSTYIVQIMSEIRYACVGQFFQFVLLFPGRFLVNKLCGRFRKSLTGSQVWDTVRPSQRTFSEFNCFIPAKASFPFTGEKNEKLFTKKSSLCRCGLVNRCDSSC